MNKKLLGIFVAAVGMASMASASVACNPDGVANVVGSTINCGPFVFSNFTVTPNTGASVTISMTAFSFSSFDPITGFADLSFQLANQSAGLNDVLFGYKVTGPL